MSQIIFISHRHVDKQIADVIQKSLLKWGVPKSDIFYSSAASGDQGPRQGEWIHPEVRKAASKAKLFIWVYTFAEADWAWCMHELGLALGAMPGLDSEEDTQVMVFQCTNDEPKILREIKRVTIEISSLREFIRTILCTYPTKENPYRSEIDDETLYQLAEDFYTSIREKIPREQSAEYYRWDNFTLTLSAEDVNEIQDRYNPDIDSNKLNKKLEMIRSRAQITSTFGGALMHFGWSHLLRKSGTTAGQENVAHIENNTLDGLIVRWKQALRYKDEKDPKWVTEMLEEIKRAIDLVPAKPHHELMRSALEHREDYFYPIVNHARMLQDGSMEFVIYMYRIIHNVPWLDVSKVD